MSDDEETFGSGATIGEEWRPEQGAVDMMEQIRREAEQAAGGDGGGGGGGAPPLAKSADDDNLETFVFRDDDLASAKSSPQRAPAPAAVTSPMSRRPSETPLAQLKSSPWVPSVWSSRPMTGPAAGGWGTGVAGTSASVWSQAATGSSGWGSAVAAQQQPPQTAPSGWGQAMPMRMQPQQQQQQQQQQQLHVFRQGQQMSPTQAQMLAQQAYAAQLAQQQQQQQLLAAQQQRQAALAAQAQAQAQAQASQQQQQAEALAHMMAQLQIQSAQQQQQRTVVTSAADLEARLMAAQRAAQVQAQTRAAVQPGSPQIGQQQMPTPFGIPAASPLQSQIPSSPGRVPTSPVAATLPSPLQQQQQQAAPQAQQKEGEQQQQQAPQEPKLSFQPAVRQQTYEPFIRDPAEPTQYRGGKKYMKASEINDIVTAHYEMLRSTAPYVEDYYRLNYLSKRQLGTAQQLQYLQQHKPIADAVVRTAKREALPSPYVLGKIPFVTSKTPRPMLSLTMDEGGVTYETDHIGVMRGEHYNTLLGVENSLLLVTDTEDLDKLISSASSMRNLQLLQEYFKKRRMGLGENLALYIAALCTDQPTFLSEALGVRKGAAMLLRALKLMPTSQRIIVAQSYVRSFATFVPAQANTDLRHLQLEIAQFMVEASRAASAPQASALLNAFVTAYRTPEQWSYLLRLSEMICVAGAVLQRGGELGMHKAPQALPEGATDEDVKALEQAHAAWREAYGQAHRSVVEALHGVYKARVAGMAAVPPTPPAPLPSAVWNMLAALALLSSPEQKEVLRAVIGYVVGVAGLEQSASNPAVLALHHILLH
eukprot:m51a1_g2722 hypothetical protein (819) ;mRNA; r:855626-859110